MAIYRLKTFKDIVDAVREQLKIQSSDTTTINRIKREVNYIYEDTVCSENNWRWLRKSIDITHQPYVDTGTASVTQGSRSVTLSSAPADSKKGFKFSTNEKIYTIAAHTAGATAVELETEFVDDTNATAGYKIWTDAIPLPPDFDEIDSVYLDEKYVPIELTGLQAHRERVLMRPKEDGRPRAACVSEFIDPDQFSVVAGAPTITKRESAGLTKILTLSADPSDDFPVGTRIQVHTADDDRYNGEWLVSDVDASNKTITYTGKDSFKEAEIADTNATIERENNPGQAERYKALLIHPSISSDRHNVHVDYFRCPKPMENDDDEPLMPIKDRRVLLYGALSTSWVRERNEEMADKNEAKFWNKLNKMAGKLDSSSEAVRFRVSKNYLAIKRNRIRLPYEYGRID